MKNNKNKDVYGLLVLRALEFFIENPYEEIYLREFSRKLKISPNTAQRFLDLFLKEDFINEEKKANLRIFKANLDNIVFRQIKITYSIKKIRNSGLIDFLKEKFSSVILFGSIAKGLNEDKSDIDLVCIGKDIKKINSYDFEKKLKKEINLHIFSRGKWKKQATENKAFYQDIIVDGINLIGEIPIID